MCGFESKAIPTHGMIENVQFFLKEYPEKIIHMDIVVVDVPDVWGMLLSRKFASKLGGTLKMDLTHVNIPLKYGTIGHLPNVPVTRTHVQELSDYIEDDKEHDEIIQSLHEYSPNDIPFATKEDFDQIQWTKKKEYKQLLDKYTDKEVGTIKILKKAEDDVQIHQSQQEVFTADSLPPPSSQYTMVFQGTTKYQIRKYK
jgi:hypothetical protein